MFQGRVLSKAGPSTAPPALVNCDEDDPNPYLRIGHIPRTHYAKWFFDATQVRYIQNLVWLCGTYGGLRQHELIRSVSENPNIFEVVVQHLDSALPVAYFKALEVEIRER